MRNIAMLAFLMTLALLGRPACAEGPSASNWDLAGWHLVWGDELNGPDVDPANWTAEVGDGSPQNPGWGNAESEYYTGRPENLSIVKDGSLGVLRIRARLERFGGRYYTSARIKTQGKRAFRFGRVEARIKLPRGKGLWPALWLLGDSISTAGWPACGEIDIMEMRGGNDSAVLGTLHWRGQDGAPASSIPGVTRLSSGSFADAYHLFGVEWTEEGVGWYLDGKKYASEPVSQPELEAFRSGTFFLLLNLAVGGRFLGNEIPPIGFREADMLVDWVRWYGKG